MGSGESQARGSLRFSFGPTSAEADCKAVGAVIGEAVERARRAGRS
jgi:cysteine desulfurase